MSDHSFAAVMDDLESKGTAQNRKVYSRHGAIHDRTFGVSFANLNALRKKIKTNNDLALQLWETDVLEPRILACMIADAAAFTQKELESWARELDSYIIADQLSALAARTPHAEKLAAKWSASKKDFIGQAGWNLVGILATRDKSELSDDFFAPYLKAIATTIHTRANRTRHAMNMALCGIGISRASLRPESLRVAKQIGDVAVDHGETSCKTPNALEYINHALKHQAGKPAATTKRSATAMSAAKKNSSSRHVARTKGRKS